MIISRESRKSRKIIHRYRSYVAVRMANASEMMRFRVICEIRVRQKSSVKREYFYNAFSLVLGGSCLSLRPANYVSKRSAEKKLQIDILRASLITPPPYGHPLYKQRGSL